MKWSVSRFFFFVFVLRNVNDDMWELAELHAAPTKVKDEEKFSLWWQRRRRQRWIVKTWQVKQSKNCFARNLSRSKWIATRIFLTFFHILCSIHFTVTELCCNGKSHGIDTAVCSERKCTLAKFFLRSTICFRFRSSASAEIKLSLSCFFFCSAQKRKKKLSLCIFSFSLFLRNRARVQWNPARCRLRRWTADDWRWLCLHSLGNGLELQRLRKSNICLWILPHSEESRLQPAMS